MMKPRTDCCLPGLCGRKKVSGGPDEDVGDTPNLDPDRNHAASLTWFVCGAKSTPQEREQLVHRPRERPGIVVCQDVLESQVVHSIITSRTHMEVDPAFGSTLMHLSHEVDNLVDWHS